MVIPSGRSSARTATARPAIGAVYLGTWKESSRSWSHLTGQDQSSSGPSSVPIAVARRPAAERNAPGRAGPASARGDGPSGKAGMVVPESGRVAVTAGGAPGARGGGRGAGGGADGICAADG